MLYFSGTITDTTIVSPTGTLANGDAVRIAVDGWGDGLFRFLLDDHDVLVGSDGTVRDFEVYAIAATAVTSPTVGGWQFEVSIPAASFDATIAVDGFIGLIFGIQDNTGSSTWTNILTGAKLAGRFE
jgi:hypothetical protein